MARQAHQRTADGWRLAQHRGEFAASLYEGGRRVSRRRVPAADEAEAQQFVRRLNQERERRALGTGPLTVGQLYELYVKDRLADGKDVSRMRSAWKALAGYWGSLVPDSVTKEDSRSYIALRKRQGVSSGGIRTEMAYLHAALRFAADEKHIDRVPSFKLPPAGRPREAHLTREEVRRLLAAAVDLHTQVYIALAIATAGRPSHILQLTWDRVDLSRQLAVLDDPERDETRKGRATVPLNDTAMGYLRTARSVAETRYVIEYNGSPIASVKKTILACARRAGLPPVTPYMLRHTAGVFMAEDGVDLAKIAQYMGHTSLETTRKHYARFSPNYLRDASRALDIGEV